MGIYIKIVDPAEVLICQQKSISLDWYGRATTFAGKFGSAMPFSPNAKYAHMYGSTISQRFQTPPRGRVGINPGQAQCVM